LDPPPEVDLAGGFFAFGRESNGNGKEYKQRSRRFWSDEKNRKTNSMSFYPGLNGKSSTRDLETAFTSSEAEIPRELAEGIRKIRYGSTVFVVHDGHPVEVSKTVRIRTNRPSQKE
jgi:hypothetical protein